MRYVTESRCWHGLELTAVVFSMENAAVASPRQSPAGNYGGRHDQPLSRWNAEVNGARLTPARSIGNPNTSEDDVTVDGKIITGEDDNSARLFGQTLARLLNAPARH